ncbi:flagellar biosynthesis protein FlhB [bacterium]|jgi:flagellar biosynthetic protein FlhB|nr:flagellar biosynthesis protein FlhB [bacterium]
MGEDSGDKTEEPTPHKLREARKKGQIAKSQDMTSAILLFVSFYTFFYVAESMWVNLASLTVDIFSLVHEDMSQALFGFVLMKGLKTMLLTLAPLMFAVFVGAIVIEAVQTGFLITMGPLEPKLDNINPINGFKKFFSMKQIVELIKSVVKMSLVIAILYYVIKDEYFIVAQAQVRNLWVMMGLVGKIVMKVVVRVGLLYILLAMLDFFYQKFEFIKSMRMTKKEIKEEYKRLEGDPTVKQRQREAQRAMSQGRQMGAVPGADVVVTNPIHIAIAIEYKPDKMKTPRVVAKGKRIIAEEIKRLADENTIPIIENPPLARALFKQVEIGENVPDEHFKVVAEILAFVYNLKKNRKR